MEIYMFLIAFPFLCIVGVLLYLFFKKDLKQPEPVVEDMRGIEALITSANHVISLQRDPPAEQKVALSAGGYRTSSGIGQSDSGPELTFKKHKVSLFQNPKHMNLSIQVQKTNQHLHVVHYVKPIQRTIAVTMTQLPLTCYC